MGIITKIKECEIVELSAVLGKEQYNNATLLYNRLKNDNEIHPVFKKDYLSGKELCKWFVYELLINETHLDLKEKIDDNDYDDLKSSINEGYSMGDFTAHQIDKITDKYIGDCSF